MTLCDICLATSRTWLVARAISMHTDTHPESSQPLHWWHQPSWEALEVAADTCELCRLIVDEAALVDERNRFGYVKSIANDIRDGDTRKLRWQLFNGYRIEIFCKEKMLRLGLYLALDDESYARAPAVLQKVFGARLVSPIVDDERNFSNIKHWIDTCRSNHPKCTTWSDQEGDIRHLPTRVIDVGSQGDENVRLHITDDADKSQYIALSYCWGTPANPFLTTVDTMEQHKAGIAVSSMPKTYQDAIYVTREVGIRYIWIDALCIIQKDREDWAREAATMHRVYSRAIFTLAGHAASDTSSGLLVERSTRHQTKVNIPWPYTSGPFSSTPPYSLYVIPRHPNFKTTLDLSPLSTRGWTFQERALPARFLHLGPALTYFQCREAYADESVHSMTQETPFGFAHLNTVYADRTKVLMHNSWAETIEAFSARSLSVGTDKMPALAGVARVFAAQGLLGAYVAGIWADEFLRGLLWQVRRREGVVHRRAAAWRAPSWAWPSVDGPVENFALQRAFDGLRMLEELGLERRHTQPLMTLTASVDVDDADLYGTVEKAHIRARGALLRAVCRVTEDPAMKRRGMLAVETAEGGIVGAVLMDVEDGNAPVDAWVLPVLTCKQTRQDPLLQAEVLVLAEVTGRPAESTHGFSGRIFERVGKGRVIGAWVEGSRPEEFTFI